MGSSKKSKDKDKYREERREKKRKRRSRSGSRDKDARHHHRHHHKHKKQRSKKKEDPSPSRSPVTLSDDSLSEVEQLLNLKEELHHRSAAPPPPKISRRSSPSPPPPTSVAGEGKGGGGDVTLSIEDTNKIRAKLGLKPLKVESAPKKEEGEAREEESKGGPVLVRHEGEEFVHQPAQSITKKLQVEKLREKIAAQREKRKIKDKLRQVKTLGEDSDEEGATAWVERSRRLAKEKALAQQKNKMLEELDAQFGVGELVQLDMTETKRRKYDRNQLSGLQVQHDMARFESGAPAILTLKDSKVLDGEEDVLVNVDIVDLERAEKNVRRRREKAEEIEYEAPEVDEEGNIVQRTLLTKYDEEIVGETKKSFRLGSGGLASVQDDVPEAVRRMAKLRRLQNLELPQAQLASEYLTPDEMVSFRRVKKKKKKKKGRLTADDLAGLEEGGGEDSLVHLGSRGAREARLAALQQAADSPLTPEPPRGTTSLRDLIQEEEQVKEEHMEVDAEDDPGGESEPDDVQLQEALARSRRAKVAQVAQPSTEHIVQALREAPTPVMTDQTGEDGEGLVMTLNTTDEFCRTLGDLPTYGLAGNRTDDDQTLLQLQQPKEKEVQESRGAWEEVGIDDTRVEIGESSSAPILEEEPDASRGVANALRLAHKKGYLEKTNISKSANAALQHLRAIHYSIEDKNMDDERGRRGGGDRYMGPVTEFKDKDGYRPEVKLEYVDDEGRKLCAKEAFRYLSHKFHGKGSGKNKTEKRMKKWNEELLMRHMSSSDTPLQTLERQREKQRQLGAPYLVLSGSKTHEAMDVKK